MPYPLSEAAGRREPADRLMKRAWRCLESSYRAIAGNPRPFADRGENCAKAGIFGGSSMSAPYYEKFEKPQIIWPVIAASARFAFDRTDFKANDKRFLVPGRLRTARFSRSSIATYRRQLSIAFHRGSPFLISVCSFRYRSMNSSGLNCSPSISSFRVCSNFAARASAWAFLYFSTSLSISALPGTELSNGISLLSLTLSARFSSRAIFTNPIVLPRYKCGGGRCSRAPFQEICHRFRTKWPRQFLLRLYQRKGLFCAEAGQENDQIGFPPHLGQQPVKGGLRGYNLQPFHLFLMRSCARPSGSKTPRMATFMPPTSLMIYSRVQGSLLPR